MHLTVHGAARTTTGSMYLLETCGKRILFECGFFQGKRKESLDRNRQFPFNPSDLDYALLSHGHIDHCGNFPNLVRQGFKGPIFCNHATRDLASLMMEDSAHIQEADCAFINRRNRKRGVKNAPVAEPLYSRMDALNASRQIVSVAYDRAFDLADGITITFRDAGHILGSSEIVFDLHERERQLRLVFSGDIGRGNNEILRDPTPFEDAEVLILESTYGGRLHGSREEADKSFCEIIRRTIERKGKVIIPAFSVGRTQQLVYSLHNLTEQGLLPDVPVYVDSPLSINATEVFRMHPDCFNAFIYEKLLNHENPFGLQRLNYVRTAEESKALNEKSEPGIIIAASGMCEAGRIRHHLKNNIGDPRNTILMVGFCAPNTLGRAIIDRLPTVNIFGEKHIVKAQIETIDAFSAHADHDELMNLMRRSTGSMKRILITHGQEDQSEALAQSLKRTHPRSEILIPNLHDRLEL